MSCNRDYSGKMEKLSFICFIIIFFNAILNLVSIKIDSTFKEKLLVLNEGEHEIDGIIDVTDLIVEGGAKITFKYESSRIIVRNGKVNFTTNSNKRTLLQADNSTSLIYVENQSNDFYGIKNYLNKFYQKYTENILPNKKKNILHHTSLKREVEKRNHLIFIHQE